MVFRGVRYHLPSCLPPDRLSKLVPLLTAHNAIRADSLYEATHIITNSDTFEGWQDVDTSKTSVVSDIWVDRSIAAGKLQQASFYSASPSQIFSGVVGFSADLPVSDEEVLCAGIMALGGQWRMSLTKDVTHLFAISQATEHYGIGMQYHREPGVNLTVLLPHWFDDAARLGIADLSTEPYEWPDPAILRKPNPATPRKSQQRNTMSPQKKALYQIASWDSEGPSKTPFKIQDVWGGRRILLSTTLELKGARRGIVEDGIWKAKGVPVMYASNGGDGTYEEELEKLNDCDVLVTRYRSGKVFFKAWRAGKMIGTLSWLLHVQCTATLSSPMDQLLHYPTRPGVIEGFENHRISVTNYAGESRDYLKKLITLMGGNFTPSMSSKNTVLVAAHMGGSKTAKALEWSTIAVVNHTWLEDCFIRWQNLSTSTDKYITYPPSFSFADILGQRGLSVQLHPIISKEAEEEGEDSDTSGDEAVGGKGAVDDDTAVAVAGSEGGLGGSQNSMDENEVQGGLVPDGDVDMADNGMDSEPERAMSVDEPEFKTPPPRSAPVTPSKPKSPKKRVQGLSSSSSESEVDPSLVGKVIHVKRPTSSAVKTPKSAAKTPKSSVKSPKNAATSPKSAAKWTPKTIPRVESVSEKSEEEEEEEPPPKPVRKLVRRATQIVKPLVDSIPSPSPRRSPRKSNASVEYSPTKNKGKGKARAVSDDEGSAEESAVAVIAEKKSKPRHFSLPPTTSDSDSDLPEVMNLLNASSRAPKKPPPKAPAPVKGGAKATRTGSARTPLKTPPARTPTPPSSPLSSIVSPAKGVKRVPTTPFAVELPTLASLSASGKKKTPVTRTQSISVAAQQRASGSGSATVSEPRTRNANRASSPASVATDLDAGGGGRLKRSAATKATNRLRDEIMPDVMNYENEMRNRSKSKGRRVSGRSEPAEEEEEDEEEEQRSSKRRKLDGGARKGRASTTTDGEGDSVEVELPPKAKGRRSEVSVLRNGKPIKIMLSKFVLSDDDVKVLAKLGAKIITRASECTHLLVPNLVRTEKFLCALAVAPYILTSDWATDSIAANTLMSEEDYLLKDRAGESKYDFSLSAALDRARELKGKLFKDHMFFVTGRVKIEPELLRNVVLAHGGQISYQLPSVRALETRPGRHVISCVEDETVWRPYAAAGCRIYTSELVLTSALRVRVDWDDETLRVEGS